MDLAYVCEWERWPKSTHCPSVPLACAWSCRNLIAFTTDLRNDDQDLTRMIHILDTEHPWDVHSVNSEHSEAITCLEWDQSGSRLLSADADGQIKCWSMADHLANSWESHVGSLVEGDPIVALSWLHNGVKLALHVEKSGASSFGEKFSRVKFSPSLTLFGGKPMEGWIAVTVSGLVTVSLLKPSGQVLTSTESLCRLRGRVALADIAFTGGGNIVVATADGSSASPVQFYKVCVSVVSEKCRIDTEILPSLFMRCTADLNRKDKFPAITHLKFLARDMSEQVLLCASSQTSSIVECWSLRKEGLPVNNVFQQISPVVGDKQPMILKWRILSATNDLDRVSAVALPKLPISLTNTDLKVASDTQFYPGLGLALAFHDGSVHIVHRLSLQSMAVFYSSAAPRSADEPAVKRSRATGPAVHFKAMQLSWTSLALVGIDNHGKLSMLRISPSMGHTLDVSLALRHLLFLLEYCMVTGYDWWDTLLHVQPGMVQSLVEKLHEEYTRQNAALQQVLSTRILAMKASLCKLSPCTVARVCDYHAKLFLVAVSSTLKSLLRPHFLNTPDKSPGDRLTEVCTKITDADIDKVMINLKTEEFVLDMNTLQALQQLLQWVGDFVLYLLASLPNQGSPLRPGHSFLRDGASLGTLRELMVVIRIWGLLKPSCLPVYSATSDTQDSMSLLFRLLTKLWICCRDEGPTSEPDEALVDECCLLPSQLLIPSLDWLPVSDGLVSRLQPKQPLRLHFGKAPTLPASASALQLDGLIRCVPASAPWPLRVPCGLLLSGLDLDAGLGDVLARPVTPVPPSPSLHSVICVTSASLCMECRRAGLWLQLSPCGAQAYPAWALVHWRSVWCGRCGATEGPVGKAPRRAGCSQGRQAAAAGACGVSPYRPAAPQGRVSFLLFRRESCTIRGHIRHFPVSDAHVMGRLA
ncbi:mediator of RNA polymerase II transcription subunit 16 isoform X2 [Ursus arctos]|uniref:mediator of RNA polymerase II transcription subunit 16 isoform X2 n=1 Tax=Ursus arctos TaxID=9644 RepID=UPI0025469ED5|nr:mediator of RNA polymerase II transcription subunit 16 isoform X2 [Ursus arctos]XP_057167383.1 mediator of RNA polymerase II transcription subunit 16 isoform X2 [Ursus arctos]